MQSNFRTFLSATVIRPITIGLIATAASFSNFQEQPVNAQSNDLACNNSSFTSSISNGFLSNNPFKRLDITPQNSPNLFPEGNGWHPGNGESWGKPRYRYTTNSLNTKQWKAKVCVKSVQTLANNHIISYKSSSNPSCPINGQNYCQIYIGPRVYFEIKRHNAPVSEWRTIQKDGKPATFEIPANSTKIFAWTWVTSQPSDFRIRVEYAKPMDEFDFMTDKK